MEKPRPSEPCLSAGRSDQGPLGRGRALLLLKHQQGPAASPQALQNARAIVRTLRDLRLDGQTPTAIVLSPDLHEQLQEPALRFLWSDPRRETLFDVPVEIDVGVRRWDLKTKEG